jgi:hypothetical protein
LIVVRQQKRCTILRKRAVCRERQYSLKNVRPSQFIVSSRRHQCPEGILTGGERKLDDRQHNAKAMPKRNGAGVV